MSFPEIPHLTDQKEPNHFPQLKPYYQEVLHSGTARFFMALGSLPLEDCQLP